MSEEKVSIKDLLGLSDEEMLKPLPIPTRWSQPFWDAAREHRLILKKCDACGNVDHPPYLYCTNCMADEHTWIEASGKGKLVAYAIRDRDRAEDVLQQTYMAVYSSLDRYEQGRDFGAWIRTIARNTCRRALRDAFRDANLRKSYADAIAVKADLRRAEEEHPERRVEHLNECLQQVPENSRRLLELRYTLGKRVNDIAEKAGKTAGTIKKMLFRIRVALKECIERFEQREAHGV